MNILDRSFQRKNHLNILTFFQNCHPLVDVLMVVLMVVLDPAPPQDTATRWTKSIRKYELDAAKGSNKVNNYPMLGFVCHDNACLNINLFSQVIKRNDTHLTKKFRSAISSYIYVLCVLHVQYTITHVYHTSYVRGKTQTNTQLHFVFNNKTQYKMYCLR